MATLLRTEPDLTPRATEAIRKGSPAIQVLVSALSAAGTSEAQRELLAIHGADAGVLVHQRC